MTRIFAAGLLLGAGLITSAFAQSSDYKLGTIDIHAPWARASVTKTGAAYLELANHGSAPDKLIAASTPIAAKAELHENKMENGVMEMRPVDGIDIAPGGTATLKPGGYHLMLMGLKEPLKAGGHFPLTLTFAKAGKIDIQVPVEAVGAMQGGSMSGHDMPGMSGKSMPGHDMSHK